MGNFSALMHTDKGLALLAKAQAGATLTFTRVAVGSGLWEEGATPETRTELKLEKKSLPIQNVATPGDGSTVVTVVLTNTGLAETLNITEIGVFANDPDDGEILYQVAYAGTAGDWLPAEGQAALIEEEIRLITMTGNAENVTAQIDGSIVLATKQDVDAVADMLDGHVRATGNVHGLTLADIGAAAASHRHSYGDLDGVPAEFPPEAHGHPWSSVSDKPGTFPPEEHNHDSRYFTESESDARYLGKTERAADSSKLEGRTKAQVVAEAKVVALKGTRTTDGTWTLTGLTIGVPVYLAYRPNHTSTSNTQYVKFSVISGSQNQLRPSGNQSTQFILAAEISDADNGTGGSAVIIPNSTTLKLNISSIGTGETVAAYQ